MKLTKNHIQELYKFTRRRLVVHYDLQAELVDHLANGIEQQWQKNPKLTFDEALEREFKKFGHFGFQSVIKFRKKTMKTKYNTLLFKELKQWVSWPRILWVLLSILSLVMVLRALPQEYKWIILAVFLLPAVAYFMYEGHKVQKRFRNKIGVAKRWLLEERLHSVQGVSLSFLNMFQIINGIAIFSKPTDILFLDLIISILIVAGILINYVVVKVLPSRTELILTQTYPEYKLVSKS
ncbi:hypothetical protein [Pseudozobellia sp. WGM2]|uniref:hypothetical protein n=1 Tax=Pseudozobellia sp. WGM2 TaxID=2787625 RepID=UPI001ADF4590|nr:hypothetical protein [Pseudozobellia sp. WGM2]